MNLVSLDIETCCNVTGCKGYGLAGTACDHALSPWHGRITKIGVVGEEIRRVFNSVADFARWHGSLHTRTWVGQNFKFDCLYMAVSGVDLHNQWTHDTQLMAYVLTEKIPENWLYTYELERSRLVDNGASWHRRAGKHSLKTLAPYFLKVEPFWETENKEDDEYVLKDAEYTLRLSAVLAEKLKQRGEYEFYLRLLSWTKMLLAAELRGIEIDVEALAEKETELLAKRDELKLRLDDQWKQAHSMYAELLYVNCYGKYNAMAVKAGKRILEDSPRHLNLFRAAKEKLETKVDYDSPKQMAWLLRDYLGYNITSLEGDETTGREVLERLADEGKEDVRTFLEWRKVNKLLTSFIPTYRELAVSRTIHPIFNPANTRTGRTSSERPNLQQVPPDLRGLFKARDGYSFIGYDAAAIEAKLIALYSGDRGLFDVVDSGMSLHDVNTRIFFGLDTEANIKRDYPIHRQATKNVGFALFYGAGANRLRVTFANKGFHISDSECQAILGRFKRTYKTAIDYHKDIARFFESGEKMTNLLGRPVMIEDASEAYMKGFNSVIQGSASDLNLEGAHRAWTELQAKGIDATPLLFVHDFTMFEVRNDQVQEANEIIVRCLTDFDLPTEHGPIKLTVEGGIMNRWEK
jgi:DNA polymerase I-like protein with 3'-5' exonuclease and polymerase domains